MQLSDLLESITRAGSCLERQEQEYLFGLLDSCEELYQSRRSTREEQLFWNQFWHGWDFPKLRDARLQAIRDMIADGFCLPVKENPMRYRNFEKAVSVDTWAYQQCILFSLSDNFPALSCDIFFNLQKIVQERYVGLDLSGATPRRTRVKPAIQPEQKEVNKKTSNSNTSKTKSAFGFPKTVAPIIQETKWERRARLKRTMEEKRLKIAQSKARKEARLKAEIEARRKALRKARREAKKEAQKRAQIGALITALKEAKIEAQRIAQIEAEKEALRKAQIEARRKAQRKAQRKAKIEALIKALKEPKIEIPEEAPKETPKETQIEAKLPEYSQPRALASENEQPTAHESEQTETSKPKLSFFESVKRRGGYRKFFADLIEQFFFPRR